MISYFKMKELLYVKVKCELLEQLFYDVHTSISLLFAFSWQFRAMAHNLCSGPLIRLYFNAYAWLCVFLIQSNSNLTKRRSYRSHP